jgi:hypothetical protein
MILLPVGFNKLTSEVMTHPVEVKMQPFVHLVSKDFFSVFGYKDQMQMK